MSDKKKISVAIIGTNGLPGRYGGWDQLMENLTVKLVDDYQFYVYTSSHDAQPGLKTHNGAVLNIVKLKANGYQSVVYDAWSMVHASRKYDVLLVLGTSGCIFLPLIKFFCKKKIILNPDGAEWKRGKWNKYIKRFLHISESFGVRYADRVISDNKVMQDYFKDHYNVESSLIAYGGDNASKVELTDTTQETYGITAGSYAFKVCRIEPENNIELVLKAFQNKSTRLIIVGNWKNSSFGQRMREQFATSNNITMLDAIYDQTKLDELRSNCGIYVHGHSVGGTNPSLVEAMNLGLCCLVFDVDYNRETTEYSAHYFKSLEELDELVESFNRSTLKTAETRVSMKEIAERRYSWQHVISQYSAEIK